MGRQQGRAIDGLWTVKGAGSWVQAGVEGDGPLAVDDWVE